MMGVVARSASVAAPQEVGKVAFLGLGSSRVPADQMYVAWDGASPTCSSTECFVCPLTAAAGRKGVLLEAG